MSLEAVLTARAIQEGRAQRTALLRHRRLLGDPLQIVAWEYGVEPFTIGAIAYGHPRDAYALRLPGFPINRDLLFWALQPFAEAFNAYFARPYDERPDEAEDAETIPQIVVPNAATLGLLGRLGRRLAYLPTDGDHPADPALVRLGRHLVWLARRAQHPGQQLVIVATELLRSHWQTGMSSYEAASLAALDAWIEPPERQHGYTAAAEAERVPVGPRPEHGEGERADKLVSAFNDARRRSVDPAVAEPLLAGLRNHYGRLIDQTWRLTARCIDRERRYPEAPSVEGRVAADCSAYSWHMQWMNGPAQGRERARMTPKRAAQELARLETSQRRVVAEEAVDDPLRMIPFLIGGKAITGTVSAVDPDHAVRVGNRNYRRPQVVLDTEEPCLLPAGKKLWWTGEPRGREYTVERIEPHGDGSRVTLQHASGRQKALPPIGGRAYFSELTPDDRWGAQLPDKAPWCYRPRAVPEPTDLEASDDLETQAA